MTAQQRLYTAMEGGTPDRVPAAPKIWVDLAASLTGTSLIDVIRDPMTALEVIAEAGRACRADAIRQFHLPARRVVERDRLVLEIDERGEVMGEIDMAGGLATQLRDPSAVDLADPSRVAFLQFWKSPVPYVTDLADVRRIAVPGKQFYVDTGCAERQRRVLRGLGNELVAFGDCGSPTMAFLVDLRGMTRTLLDLVEEPLLAHAIMEKGAAIAVEKGKFNADLGLKILRLNDSVGNMNVISPAHWKEFVFPHFRDVCTELHAYDPELRIYCHMCGNVLPVAEELVNTGLDCIGPLDPLGGFTPRQMRERVGDAVALMGGVNTLSFLSETPEIIEQEAASCIREAGQTGGFILGSGCVIPRDAPLQNVAALRRAAERFGRYENGRLRDRLPG